MPPEAETWRRAGREGWRRLRARLRAFRGQGF